MSRGSRCSAIGTVEAAGERGARETLAGMTIGIYLRCGRHPSPGLNGRFGDIDCAGPSSQAVSSRQGREVGANEERRTIESQEIHDR